MSLAIRCEPTSGMLRAGDVDSIRFFFSPLREGIFRGSITCSLVPQRSGGGAELCSSLLESEADALHRRERELGRIEHLYIAAEGLSGAVTVRGTLCFL